MGWSVGRGVPSPLKKGSGEGAQPPPQNFKKKFLVQCVKKIFVFRPKGGPSPSAPPPKYATGYVILFFTLGSKVNHRSRRLWHKI